MSVYTHVDRETLIDFLVRYDVGTLVSYQGIGAGIENTNYYVSTTGGEFVLTLVEQWEAEDVPFFLELMAWLAQRGFPSARPIGDRNGMLLQTLEGRPATLVERLSGASAMDPNLRQCAALGAILGRLHNTSKGFAMVRPDHRGIEWRLQTATRLYPVLTTSIGHLIRDELAFQARARTAAHTVPRGVVHADLFRDNILYEGDEILGVIDFYYACTDLWVYDLAVAVNDWCATASGRLNEERAKVIVGAYHRERALLSAERDLWPAMMRSAALRFWLSRLQDKLFPKDGVMTTIKDPDHFERILRERRDNEAQAKRVWDEALGNSRNFPDKPEIP